MHVYIDIYLNIKFMDFYRFAKREFTHLNIDFKNKNEKENEN